MTTRRGRPRGLARALGVGERVFIRRPGKADEAEYLDVLRRSLAFHRPFSPAPPPGADPVGPEVFRGVLTSGRRKANERVLICRLEDGAIVGSAALSQIFRGVFQNAYLGYWVGEGHQRRGYTSEGVSLLLDRAFGPLGLHRVEANVMPRNEASLALVRRLGFRYEGLAERYLKIAGAWQDHEHWAMLAEDWRAPGRRRKS